MIFIKCICNVGEGLNSHPGLWRMVTFLADVCYLEKIDKEMSCPSFE